MVTVELHVRRKGGLTASAVKRIEVAYNAKTEDISTATRRAKLKFLNDYIKRDRNIISFTNLNAALEESNLEITCCSLTTSPSKNTGRANMSNKVARK